MATLLIVQWLHNKIHMVMRRLLAIYRYVQYYIFRRHNYGILKPGTEVSVEHFHFDLNHGDIVHPCVRYIAEGYLGHHWWMVYTPYYKGNASLENPILCYGDSDDPNMPPTEWKFYCLVNNKPDKGYNSDPSLLYNKELFVFWRENYEHGTHSFYRATYAAKVVKDGVERVAEPLLVASDEEEDVETSPCFMPSKDGTIMAYGMHLRFHSKRIQRLKQPFKSFVSKIVLVSDLLGIYSQQKHYGLSVWHQTDEDWLKPYKKIRTSQFRNCNPLYRPWHIDFFDWEGKRFSVVQTNQCNADIVLSVSNDDENFTIFNKPLITNASIGKVGLYKPCAGVTTGGLFYLYYTAQDYDNRSLNKLYLTTIPMKELETLLL